MTNYLSNKERENEQMDHLFSKGRSIKVEQIDGVTRQSFTTSPNANEYVTDRVISGKADVLSCMPDPRYKSDPHFREFVKGLMQQAESQGVSVNLSSGSEMGVLEKAMAADNANSDNIQEQKENILTLFKNPLYKTSAAYRNQVAAVIAQSDPRHMQEMPSFRYDAPVKLTGQFAPEPEEGSAK